MAISSLIPGKKNSHTLASAYPAKDDKLTLSQALTITAGLAGLVGLCSGLFIRFSLANSHNARFLSPLQTFPTLSDSTSETSQETSGVLNSLRSTESESTGFESRSQADSNASDFLQVGERERAWETEMPIHQVPSQRVEEPIDRDTFDAFANRGEEGALDRNSSDPWRRLEAGPQVGRLIDTEESGNKEGVGNDFESAVEHNYYEESYDNLEDESQLGY